MLNKDVSVTIILTKMLVGRRRRCHPTAGHHGEVAGIVGEQFPVSHAPKRPHRVMGPSKWVLGWLFQAACLRGENLSAHVQVYVMQLRGASIAVVLYRTAGLAWR